MKDEFINTLDSCIFRSTNDAWNKLMLNDPWSVGYVTSLIETKEWSSKEEWEEFYYKSGEERKKSSATCPIIEDFQLVRTNKKAIYNLSWDVKNINYQYGRTKNDLVERAKVLYAYMQRLSSPITLEECVECVRYRTICETWNGVIIREENTVRNLQFLLGSNVVIKKTDGEIDHKYAVDYEVYYKGQLKFGVQIKPKSYLGKAPYLIRARAANHKKFDAYKNDFGCSVYEVISKSSGEIINTEIISTMRKALS